MYYFVGETYHGRHVRSRQHYARNKLAINIETNGGECDGALQSYGDLWETTVSRPAGAWSVAVPARPRRSLIYERRVLVPQIQSNIGYERRTPLAREF